MKLAEAFRNEVPLKWTRPDITVWRVIGHGFMASKGAVTVPPFWNKNEEGILSTPMEGEVSGDGPWKVGPFIIEEMLDGDELAGLWNKWIDHLRKPAGQKASRSEAAIFLQNRFDLIG